MKKLIAPLLSIALITACSNDAQDNAAVEPAVPAAEATATPDATAPAGGDMGAMPMADGTTAGTAATATGTVESIDPAAGRIVIAHGPVEALKWPAMTMGFTATPEQAQAVQPGQKVTFDFSSQGPKNTITRIEPAQ
jgi:Cu(I)/Ag(I) efflux system protein CusF